MTITSPVNSGLIFEAVYPGTLALLLERFSASPVSADVIEAWTFDDVASRKNAEKALASRGITVRIRSAYKPLLHFFLEEVRLDGLSDVRIGFPVSDKAPANRFTLEAYPLAALVGSAKLSFTPKSDDNLTYDVTLVYQDGTKSAHSVFAPNRVHADAVGETNLSPTGWLKFSAQEHGERFETDYEAAFSDTMQALATHEWGQAEPYFGELNIRISLPARDQPLSHDEEVVSLAEALHEDLYFSCLEFFQKKSGRPLGDRGLRPGQIVPEIVAGNAQITVRVEKRDLCIMDEKGASFDLATASEPLFANQLVTELQTIGGIAFEAKTRSGRIISARYIHGSDAAVMISAGQHANETTGIVGALRAAHALKSRPSAHFTISPLENPDGYALHRRLRADNPRHMHHAARYTALGDDLEYRTVENAGSNLFEKAIRLEAERLSGAQLHVNLHGYPSHEWTRPLSGYVPRNFGMWTLPKGFFLIMRHHPDWQDASERLLDRVTSDLGKIPGLLDYNAGQIGLYEVHAGETGFRIINGFPCMISVDDRHAAPMTLITEYPDETIYGQKFIDGHTAQMQTVLSAYDAFQEISAIS